MRRERVDGWRESYEAYKPPCVKEITNGGKIMVTGPIPRDFVVIDLGWGLDICIFQST